MKGIFLLLGSNLDNRTGYLEEARKLIEKKVGNIVKSSSVYETEPWGVSDQPLFINQVIQVETKMAPEDLLKSILEIELTMGRKRIIKWGHRIIDIDILYYHDQVHQSETITIPHPQIQNRNFTLAPMVELVPDEVHPIFIKTQQELLSESNDKLKYWVLKE
jgi:2-amino-4-hydroxy-6-hydroxymethyldihydropteridine diphosphokinase